MTPVGRVRCEQYKTTHAGRRAWLAWVGDVPVGVIHVDVQDVIELLYVAPGYRRPHFTTADDLVKSARHEIPGLCHDGHQSERGQDVMERLHIPQCSGTVFKRWDGEKARSNGRIAFEETCRVNSIPVPGEAGAAAADR